MTAHIMLPHLTGTDPATLSHAAITGLLRERLGYQGVIVTDALDMHGASGVIGIPEAAVRALAAGADLLCLGSREYADSVHAILAAIVAAARCGRLPVERLEEAAERTARLSAWLAGGRPAVIDRAVGLAAARRAVRLTGELSPVRSPLIVELEAPGNIAVGPVPWGLSPWAADAVRVDGATADAAELLGRAADRSLVIVVRDAHRHAEQRAFAGALLSARPDAVVVEMGLPIWQPGSATHLATYGASHAAGQAAAELLGLTAR
jgi:beta-N-acetylhexosaminidase